MTSIPFTAKMKGGICSHGKNSLKCFEIAFSKPKHLSYNIDYQNHRNVAWQN